MSQSGRRERDLIDAARQQAATPLSPPGSATAVRQAGAALGNVLDLDARRLSSDSIPGYVLQCELHRGGQGVVYDAQQVSTGRRVAIKVLREGPFAGASDIARFEREVQILGQLQHPNIVGVLDRGVAAGHFYYAMDFVDGAPLDRWAEGPATAQAEARSGSMKSGSSRIDDRSGSVAAAAGPDRGSRAGRRRIIEVFLRVCDAVHAAHLRGVIHRDLKPGNILVDRRGEPRVLDFGLAKLTTGADEPAVTAMTQSGMFLGSLPWASPEQARGDAAAVDLRTDVYSLGVILYRLITGRFPYDTTGRWRDTIDHIMHAEPLRPSAALRLAAVENSGRSVSVRYARLRVDEDLETIVLKCLQKDPARRYQSAGELAGDLRSFLAGEAIAARRDSLAYMVRTYLRRHRGPVAIGAGFALIILAGLATAVTLWQRAAVQRDRALAAEVQSEARRLEAESVSDFLRQLVAAADPMQARGRGFTVLDLLNEFDIKLEQETPRSPRVEATLRTTMAVSYRQLGELDKAARHLARARELYAATEAEAKDRINVDVEQALVQRDQGDWQGAATALEDALLRLRRALGPDAPDVIELAIRLGDTYMQLGSVDRAERLLASTAELARTTLGARHVLTASALQSLAGVYLDREQFAKAEQAYRASLDTYRALYGQRHPNIATALSNLATCLHAMERYEESDALLDEAEQSIIELYGPAHPRLAEVLQNRSRVRESVNDYAGSEAILRRALELQRPLGPDHIEMATTLNNLGQCVDNLGRYDEAVALLQESLALQRRSSPDGRGLPTTLSNLAGSLYNAGRLEEADACIQEAFARARRVLQPDTPEMMDHLKGVSYLEQALGRLDDAAGTLRTVIDLQIALHGADTAPVRANRGRLRLLLTNIGLDLLETGSAKAAADCFAEALIVRFEADPGEGDGVLLADGLLAAALSDLGQAGALRRLQLGWETACAATAADVSRAARAIGERLARELNAAGDSAGMDVAQAVRALGAP